MTGDEENPELEIRRLVEELQTLIELRKHGEVSSLCSKLCLQLVGLIDDMLASDLDEETITLDTKCKILILIVEKICDRLRAISQVAAACDDVEYFVHLRDMVAFTKMLATNGCPKQDKSNKATLYLHYDKMASLLRKSIYLFGRTSPSKSANENKGEIYLSQSSFSCYSGSGFAKYTLNLREILSSNGEGSNLLQTTTLNQLYEVLGSKTMNSEDDNESDQLSLKIIQSDWFISATLDLMDKDYPLNRFTILTCIWIIGTECNHKLVEQLIGDLVDRIYHQEANGCIEVDDLTQLTQIGSFWLTYHKRYMATTGHQSDQLGLTLDSPEDEDDDDNYLSDQERSGSFGSNENLYKEDNSEGDATQVMTSGSKSKLRKLIDEELVNGTECLVCRYAPQDFLEPLKNSANCSNCSNGPNLFCSISFKPFNLISLDSIIKQTGRNLNELVIYSPSEWLRHLIEVMQPNHKDQLGQLNGEISIAGKVSERVDITENFERLTMVRGPAEESMKSIEPTGVGDDDDDVDSEGSRDESDSLTTNLSLKCLRDFFSDRKSKLAASGSDQLTKKRQKERKISESLQVIQFVTSGVKNNKSNDTSLTSTLSVCASDVYLMDRLHGSQPRQKQQFGKLSIRIASTRHSDAEAGGRSILHCNTRSLVSKLILGCNRYFDSFELVLSYGQGSMGVFECPYCECHLEEIQTLGQRETGNISSIASGER